MTILSKNNKNPISTEYDNSIKEIDMMEEVRISDLLQIKNGYAFKSEDYQKQGIPLLRITNIENEKVHFGSGSVFLPKNFENEYSDFLVKNGDVVIALSGATTGKFGVYTLKVPSLLNQRIGLIRSGSSDRVDSTYFYYFLNQIKAEILNRAQGVAQPNISTKEIGQFQIPLPPLPVQQKIAAILDAADLHRQKTKTLIEKYDQLTQSIFLEMFGDPVKNEKGWETRTFSECIIDMQNGIGKNKEHYGFGTKVANIGDLYPSFSFRPVKYSLLNVTDDEERKYRLKYGDLLFVRSSLKREGVAICSFYDSSEICLFSSFMIKASPNLQMLNPYFISIQMRATSYRSYIINAANTATITNISQPNLKSLNVIVPPLPLQEKFSLMVKEVESQKIEATKSLHKSEELFNTLLQHAFKGELVN
jgi:type I restriction enzyme, S subunit